MKENTTPIFIIGSARNGTTNLENTVASFPEVAAVEHWLHYGSCESSIYMNQHYWGDISTTDSYIDFLYRYSSSDYFQLANGDIQYHLERPRENFYEFFFDLMDHHTEKQGKKYWISKLDPHFFIDPNAKKHFFYLLKQRYEEVKFLRIKRDFTNAFKSYRNMEGKNYDLRQKSTNLLPALLIQASRYGLTYQKDIGWDKDNILDISFTEYITDRREYLQKIAKFLEIDNDVIENLNIDRFQVNTSFVNKEKKQLPTFIGKLMPKFLSVLQKIPTLARLIWKTYFRLKPQSKAIFRRLIKYKYFKRNLLEDLSSSNANGLIQQVKDEDFTTNS